MADKGFLSGIKTKPEPEPDDSELQDVGPCGWVWVKGCKALDIERGEEPIISLQYVYLAVLSEFTPTKFWVIFVGLQSWKVMVEGRNLRSLYDRMNDHCLRRVRRADRDFGGNDGKPFVTRIEVIDVTPEDDRPSHKEPVKVKNVERSPEPVNAP